MVQELDNFRNKSIKYGIIAFILLVIALKCWIPLITDSMPQNRISDNDDSVQVTNFWNKSRINLGTKDGQEYILILSRHYSKFGDVEDEPGNKGEYVIVKRRGYIPEFEEFKAPEGTSRGEYAINSVLNTEDVSDLITEEMVAEHPNVFDGSGHYSFRVIDYDKDIVQSSSDAFLAGMGGFFLTVISFITGIIVTPLTIIYSILFASSLKKYNTLSRECEADINQ